MRKIFMIMFLLVPAIANAELWVCQSGSSLVRKHGDGVRLGICDINNTNIDPSCIEATKKQYDEAGLPNKKLVNGDVVDMTQAEIDAKAQAQADAQTQAKMARLKAIDDKLDDIDMSIVLTKADTAIDNIRDLDDAKIFLKRFVQFVIALQSGG